MTLDHEAAVQAGLSAPPVGVVAITIAGIELQDWVFILTLVWIGMQMVWFTYDKVRRILAERREARLEGDA